MFLFECHIGHVFLLSHFLFRVHLFLIIYMIQASWILINNLWQRHHFVSYTVIFISDTWSTNALFCFTVCLYFFPFINYFIKIYTCLLQMSFIFTAFLAHSRCRSTVSHPWVTHTQNRLLGMQSSCRNACLICTKPRLQLPAPHTHKILKNKIKVKTTSGTLLWRNTKSCGGRLSHWSARPVSITCSALVLRNQRVSLHHQLSLWTTAMSFRKPDLFYSVLMSSRARRRGNWQELGHNEH